VFSILSKPRPISKIPSPRVRLPDRFPRFAVQKVHFSYGDQDVLKGIDLKVDKGQVLALVGMSGGGKSTIANLIPRFFDVTDGRICIDGIDVREIAVADLRRQIAIVTQEPIFSMKRFATISPMAIPMPRKTRSLPRQRQPLPTISFSAFPKGTTR
jgi:subfamily B ATP-binding cassette protein MsbA